MSRSVLALVVSVFLSGLPALSSSAPSFAPTDQPSPRRLYLDVPLWDISDEGLPFRLTLGLPSRRDALSRLLFATDAQWMLSVGYAKVYNSYDTETDVFKNPGGHAALFSAGRQFRWHPPEAAGAFTPKLVVEVGAHYATRPFPADGTRANIMLISGLEWTWQPQNHGPEWGVAVIWPHFSNANLFSRNAGYDGLCLRFGRSVQF